MLEGAIQSDGIEELFETGKHISVDIFSDEYMDKINAIQLPNTKIKILQRLLSQEGLDFHNYCRRIVHWNLPSNPIDVGRILRTFKIKKNAEVTDNGKIII